MASSNVHFFSWIKAFRGATLPPKSPVMSGAFFLAPELKAPPVSYFDWSSLLHSISCWASSTSPQMQSLIPKVSTHSKLQSSRQVLFDYDSADWEILLYALSKKIAKHTNKQTNKRKKKKPYKSLIEYFVFWKSSKGGGRDTQSSTCFRYKPVFSVNQSLYRIATKRKQIKCRNKVVLT